ncbi:pre-peptidase C-terminal domain-containing protein [Lysobacter sp. A6]|uniref:Pre-peptidase C-terminal domain-containing protein n=1 Tax=Noviluteimonas lactosilytica TaxID=2888523 RepID=A0ABS8JE79_9GAMM|nr:PilC/PilY family type IV pilus protein [Lysobacter lactosilyticus]MCC8361855.1 pre-peptidase C-terminal domain-containing protein [Lysobacter lactosilyticus]
MASHPVRRSIARSRLVATSLAFCATLLALPGAAVNFPDVPLQSGTAYPPANVMFILDDSGSMEWDFMPGAESSSEVPSVSPVNIALNAYTRNTLYYNPSIAYQPWIRADDTRYTSGTAYDGAWSHDSLLQDSINLGSNTRTFYAPKAGATNMGATSSYYRYQITIGGGDMIRSEYGTVGTTTNVIAGFPQSSADANTGNMAGAMAINVPAGTAQLVVSSAGGTHGDNGNANNNDGDGAQLYLRYNAHPDTNGNRYDCRSRNDANVESCTIDNPTPGTWYVAMYANSSFRNVQVTASLGTTNRCGGGSGANDWINCTSARPEFLDANNVLTSRSLSAELVNYATWYSYHRTRIKLAKAGASEAFSRLAGSTLRVGYDSIWNRNPYNIPVGNDNGVFSGQNRTDWFSHLHAANGNSGTPLKGALQRAGEYFSDASATGPWGPLTGDDQLSCRQNFAILTTDGYWNDNSGYGNPVGDADNEAGPTILGPSDASYTYAPERPYIDNFSGRNDTRGNTLADVAMHYWKRDLVSTLENNVPTSLNDPAFWQHMVTFGVSIGLQGRLNPNVDLVSITNGSKRWGDPTDNEDADRIDDLWHAAVNGRGDFVAAKDPNEFAQAMVDALKTVAARLGSASNVTANSTSFSTDSRVYQATYVSGQWVGELAAYDASEAGLAPEPAWRASPQIAYAGRKVFTWTGTAGATFPTAGQVGALTRTNGIAPIDGATNANYIKGDWGQERRIGGTLRNRESLLGDIVNSSPAYLSDTRTLFVGANDGMLHAFNSLTGAELFAFVPAGLDFAALSTLSDPQYSHKHFVDGPIVVSSLSQTPGRNLLVGALGRGGKGVFGLDVTSPSGFGASNALWELRDDNGDMGHVIGEPLIVTLNDAARTRAVLVPNGINSTNGNAVLFVIDVLTGELLKKIDTGVGADNALFDPRGRDVDNNGTVDYVYAGDRHGNLWKFDLAGDTRASWVLGAGGQPLYRTRTGQPITSGLAIARNPMDNKPWVYFGTGSYMTLGDASDMTIQTLYGIIDENATLTEADLQSRDIAATEDYNGLTYRVFERTAPLPAGKKGWFLDWDNPTAGERMVVRPQMRGGAVVTSTMVPPTALSCDAGGTGYINAIQAFTGTAMPQPFFDKTGEGSFNDDDTITATLPDGTTVKVGAGSVSTGGGSPTEGVFVGNRFFYGMTDGKRGSLQTNAPGGNPRRVMWREILQD